MDVFSERYQWLLQQIQMWGVKIYHVDATESFLIGDSQRDIDAAEAAGVKGYLFTGTNLLDFMKTII